MTGGGNGNGAGDPTGRNDDGFSGPIPLGFSSPLSFFGTDYTSFFANNNGNISFTGGNAAFVPTGPIGATVPTISVFFGDVDTRGPLSGVMHIRTDIPNQIIINWDSVGYFNSNDDLLNNFQLVLRGSDYVVPVGEGNIGFFWGSMNWTDTDTSTTAAVGFIDGAGNGTIVGGSNSQLDFNVPLNFHQIWFDPNLRPINRVPEIDAASGAGALTLLTGVLALVNERRRRTRGKMPA